MSNTGRQSFNLLAALLLAAAVFIGYFATLNAGFVYDDPILILDNPLVTETGVGLGEIFGRPYISGMEGGGEYYRPLMTLLFRIEYALYNGTPAGFHLNNILMHCGNCILLYLLLLCLGTYGAAAFAAALLFAVHPIATESIAWISGRTDPLAFLFMLLSLLLLIRYLQAGEPAAGSPARERSDGGAPGKMWLLAVSLLFGTAAFLVKEIAFILPFVVLVLLLCRTARSPERSGLPRIRVALIFGAFAGLAFLVNLLGENLSGEGSQELYFGRGGMVENGLTFLSLVPAYLGKLFWPADLNIARPVSLATSVLDLRVLGGVLILLVAAAVLILAVVRRRRALAMGASLFIAVLLMASNLIPIAYSFKEMDFPFFERYLYIPLAGLLMMLTGFLPRSPGRVGRAVEGRAAEGQAAAGRIAEGQADSGRAAKVQAAVVAVALCLCPFLMGATWKRCQAWHDNVSLFRAGVERYPESYSLWFNLGYALHFEARDAPGAYEAFHEAVRLNPAFTMARVQEAVALFDLGRLGEAEQALEAVIREEPANGQAHEALGFIYANLGDWDRALEHYARAAMLLQGNPASLENRDKAAERLKYELEHFFVGKEFQKVLERVDRAIRWLPDCAWAHEARGLALLELGDEAGAVEALEVALSLDAQSAMAMVKLIPIYDRTGREEEARLLRTRLRAIQERLPPPGSLPGQGE